jgi:DNA-binding transcriptional LysR family regulator
MRNLNRVHLNGLRALEAVGRLGSLQAAAEELGVTVGAVSQQVIKAEEQLGRAIFKRTARGLRETTFGAPFLARLSTAFRQLSEAVATTRRRDDAILTISVAPIFASRWLIHRIDRFSAAHPDISLRIEATMTLVDVARSDVDLGIRVGPGGWPDVATEFLIPQVVFPVCAPALAERIRTPQDLAAQPAVVDGNDAFTWERWLKAAGFDVPAPKTRHVFSDASLCLDAALSGQGVLLGYPVLASWALKEGRLVAPFPIRVETGMGYYFVAAPGIPEPRKVTVFKRWLRAALAEDEDGFAGAVIPARSAAPPSSP